MNTIYLVRHGENPANIHKQFSHRKVDLPLTEKGLLQARQTADYFREIPVDEVYTSPLVRAVQTADVIAQAKGLSATPMEAFREVDAGDMEGMEPTDENWRMYMNVVRDWYDGKPESAFPGGENYLQAARRVLGGLHSLVDGKSGKSIVVVGHGGIFVVAVTALCLTSDLTGLRGSPLQNCGISEITAWAEDGRLKGDLVRWASCDHLSGEAAELVSAVPEKFVRYGQD
jgi:broad specificity phosphatase PhoE